MRELMKWHAGGLDAINGVDKAQAIAAADSHPGRATDRSNGVRQGRVRIHFAMQSTKNNGCGYQIFFRLFKRRNNVSISNAHKYTIGLFRQLSEVRVTG